MPNSETKRTVAFCHPMVHSFRNFRDRYAGVYLGGRKIACFFEQCISCWGNKRRELEADVS